VIVPVETEHVGCSIETVGTEGVKGCAVIVALATFDMQLTLFFAVTLYVPVERFVKTPVGFV
jgi:hypothetical protein